MKLFSALGLLLLFLSPAFAEADFRFLLNVSKLSQSQRSSVELAAAQATLALPETLKAAIPKALRVNARKLVKEAGDDPHRLIQALIREAARAYDRGASRTVAEAEVLASCDQRRTDDVAYTETEQACIDARYLARAISSRREYISASGWANGTLLTERIKPRNRLLERSPDPREFEDLAESFATNFAFFLTDSEYGCRRPLLHELFVSHFSHVPFPNSGCELNTEVVTSSMFGNSRLENIDPSRVYAVHYLLAARGDGMMSRFGHSMFRLITCSPHRREVGPECLKDVSYHVVLSFRANVADLTISQWKGLVGGYPSQLFVLSMTDVLEEYSKGELRDLWSYPIALSPDEKTRFLFGALEHFWQYRGNYEFLTTNCATESYWLLRTAIRDPEFARERPKITPRGLLKLLSSVGRVPKEPDSIFQSSKKPLAAAIKVLNQHSPTAALDLKRFIEMKASERGQLLKTLLAQAPNDRVKIAASLYLLELHVQRSQLKALLERLLIAIDRQGGKEGLEKKHPELGRLLDLMKSNVSAPASRMLQSGSYGVPLQAELLAGQSPLNSPENGGLALLDQLDEGARSLGVESLWSEIRAGARNIQESRRAISQKD